MPGKSLLLCPEFSCRKKITSDSVGLKNIKFHHSEHLQVAHQKNQTFRSAPRPVELTHGDEFDAIKDSIEDLDVFPYLEHLANSPGWAF
jgi:hypothetical protein